MEPRMYNFLIWKLCRRKKSFKKAGRVFSWGKHFFGNPQRHFYCNYNLWNTIAYARLSDSRPHSRNVAKTRSREYYAKIWRVWSGKGRDLLSFQSLHVFRISFHDLCTLLSWSLEQSKHTTAADSNSAANKCEKCSQKQKLWPICFFSVTLMIWRRILE